MTKRILFICALVITILALVLIVIVALYCANTVVAIFAIPALVIVTGYCFGYSGITKVKGPGVEYEHQSQEKK